MLTQKGESSFIRTARIGGSLPTVVAIAILLLGLFYVSPAAGDVLQDRLNIGIGPVSSGLGSGPGVGTYNVTIYISSHKRYGVYVDDGGHEEWYCSQVDQRHYTCGTPPPFSGGIFSNWFYDWVWVDGVKLSNDKIQNSSGLAASSWVQRKIEGPFEVVGGGKWEWASEGWMNATGLPDSVRETTRNYRIIDLTFPGVNWTGNRLSSKVRARWKESDPWFWDDHSDYAYFNTGDMITKCLQGNSGRTLLSASNDYYWHLCSQDGTCRQDFVNVGPNGLHYNIATYYNVSCSWMRVGVCGNGSCTNGETHSSCPADCPPAFTCNNGVCEFSGGESAFNCPQDCGLF